MCGYEERRAAYEGDGEGGLRATEIGDAVHRLLDEVDLARLRFPTSSRCMLVPDRARDEELDRIRTYVAWYCDSELAHRVAACARSTRSVTSPSSVAASSCTASTSASLEGTQALVSTTRRT